MMMRTTIKHWLLATLFVAGVGGATLAVAAPQTSYAKCNDTLLTFPAWYKGLQRADCSIKNPTAVGGLSPFIWRIALNVIEIALQLVGYIAVFFIIYGGFRYITSAGSSDGMTKARKTILNAIIGLVISIFSVALVNLVAGAIK